MLISGSGSPKEELASRVAQTLIYHGANQSEEPDSLSWREGIQALLKDRQQSLDWLSHIQACRAIAVTTAPDMDGVVLLLHRSTQRSISLSQTQELEVAGLVAIAFHQHHLQHQAQRSNEQLTYLNYLKEDFLSTLNHELRTPLTSMMLAIRMLRRPDLTPERVAMYLDILEQQCTREINLVNDLLMLQTVNAKQPKTPLVPIDLVQFLTELGEREHQQFARAKLKLLLELPEQSIMMATSREYLTRILQELLTNARKYANSGSTITLQLLDNLASTQSVKLCLTNTGAGIQPEELPHIFDKFRRGQNATKNAIPGTGTGLALVKGLLEQLRGVIAVTSQPITQHIWQTCFTVELPVIHEKAKCA
jgi:signal transduction histidine kinase